MKTILALGVALFAAASTWAQPVAAQPAAEPGKAANPAGADPMAAMDKAMADQRKNIEQVMKMTPAQRRDWMLGLQEQGFRAQAKAYGFGDLELQDTIWKHAREQEAARAPVRMKAARLRDALAAAKATPESIRALSGAWMQATEEENERRKGAEEGLRQALKLDANPRLEAFLLLHGIIGDAAWTAGGLISASTLQVNLPDAAEVAAATVAEAAAAVEK
jgi:hypothetical protein